VSVADWLRRQRAPLRSIAPRLLLGLNPPPPGRRRHSELALERPVERGLALEADRVGDVGHAIPAVAQHVGCDPHPPAGAIAHRRLADQLDEPLTKDGARYAGLAR